MGKTLSYAFELTGAVAGSFRGAVTSARSQIAGLGAGVREMEKSATGHLGASFAASSKKLAGLSTELKSARSTLATLKNQAAAAGGANDLLARQIGQAEKRVSSLTSANKRAVNSHRNLAASITTEAGSVGKLMHEYAGLSAQIEKTRAKQKALSANLAARDANKARRGELRAGLFDAMALASTVAFPAKFAIDFEYSMSRVGAVSRASKEDLTLLTAQARQLGRDTVFSASQAAEGMQFLAMAGFRTKDIMAAMPGMLGLAAAAGTDLGRTADIASNILSGFKIPANEMDRVADVLVQTFTSSNTTLEMLGETMKYVAPVASAVNMSLEDTAATVGLLGNVGIQASQAGTGMRAMLLRLAAPPKMTEGALAGLSAATGDSVGDLRDLVSNSGDAAKALKKLGVKTKDARGNLRPMSDILEEMNIKMAGMGSAKKMEVARNVFGMNAAAAGIEILTQAGKTVDDYGNKIVDAAGNQTTALRKAMEENKNIEGTWRQVSRQMNDNTRGELIEMKSALEDVAITVGDLFSPTIRSMAGDIKSGATAVSGLMQEFPVLSKTVGLALGGTIGLAVAAKTLAYGYTFVKGGLLLAQGALIRTTGLMSSNTAATKRDFGAMRTAGLAYGTSLGTPERGLHAMGRAGERNFRIIGAEATAMRRSIGLTPFAPAVSGINTVNRANGGGAFRSIGRGVSSMAGIIGLNPFGAVIMGLMLVIENWDSIVTGMNKATAAMQSAIKAADDFIGLDQKTKAAVNTPVSERGSYKDGTRFARGGVVTRPTFALIGEAGSDESVIPHDGSKRAIGLWKQAGQALGVLSPSSATAPPPAVTPQRATSPHAAGLGSPVMEQPKAVQPAGVPQTAPATPHTAGPDRSVVEQPKAAQPVGVPQTAPATPPALSQHAAAPAPALYTPPAQPRQQPGSAKGQPLPVAVEMPMTFDVKGLDEAEFRKKVEGCKPQIEEYMQKLVKRIVTEMEHNQTRVRFAQ